MRLYSLLVEEAETEFLTSFDGWVGLAPYNKFIKNSLNEQRNI